MQVINRTRNILKMQVPFIASCQGVRKLTIVLSLILLAFAFIQCKQDEETKGLTVDFTRIEVDCKDSVLTGVTSDFDISYTIDDPYIASIKGNFVVGKHVGSTVLTATSNNESQDIWVEVNSAYQLFPHPIDDYANGKEYYRNKYDNLEYKDDTTYIYLQVNYEEQMAYYVQINFTKENTTKDAILIFNIGSAGNALTTLLEQFDLYDYTEDGYLFINALLPEDATEIAILQLDRENQLCYVYLGKMQLMASNTAQSSKFSLSNRSIPKLGQSLKLLEY